MFADYVKRYADADFVSDRSDMGKKAIFIDAGDRFLQYTSVYR